MGRPHAADEHLPEVVPQQPPPMASASPLPEVVPDSSPEFAQQRYYIETDKYPAHFDTAPKMPHEGMPPGSEQQYQQQQWRGAEPEISALSPNSSLPWQSFPQSGDDQTYVDSEPGQEKRICGIRKRLFIIIATIAALVVVGAAVGGGVGGSMAARQSSSDDAHGAETTSVSSSSSAAATSTSTTTLSTTSSATSSAPAPSISFLHNQTDPAVFKRYAFQGYSGNNFTGKSSPILWEDGFYDLGFNATSYVWVQKSSDCCVTFCTSKTDDDPDWLCDSKRQNKTSSSRGFERVSLWCGRWSDKIREEMTNTCFKPEP